MIALFTSTLHVRKYLNQKSTETLIHAFVSSRLDNCNSLLFGLPSYQISKLQRIQNIAARLVTLTNKRSHIKPILLKLHWLPISERINYKILMLVFKSIHGLAPLYISSLITIQKPTRSLRSSIAVQLIPPKIKTKTYGERSFLFAAARLWNALPAQIRNAPNFSSFKRLLKTHLFTKAL